MAASTRRCRVGAATGRFLRHGYLGTSMDQVTAAAAVSKPTVYRFFTDKEQLLTEIVLGTLARAYYERAPEQTMDALAGCFSHLTGRGLLRCRDERQAAAHFAFLVLGHALDKSLFCGDQPFSAVELTAQADAGAAAFLAAYGIGSIRADATVSQSAS